MNEQIGERAFCSVYFNLVRGEIHLPNNGVLLSVNSFTSDLQNGNWIRA